MTDHHFKPIRITDVPDPDQPARRRQPVKPPTSKPERAKPARQRGSIETRQRSKQPGKQRVQRLKTAGSDRVAEIVAQHQQEKQGVVTKIEAQKRPGRYNVYVDDRYAFPISEEVMLRYRVFKGSEVTAELAKELESADNESKAWDAALTYLSYQQRTEKEIRAYLVKKEVPEAFHDRVVDRLKSERLLDDAQYAVSYVRTMKRTSDKGPSVIRRQLIQRGVQANLIETALQNEYSSSEQLDQVMTLIEKLKRQYRKQTPSLQKQKVHQRLMEKGFSGDVIASGVAETEFSMDQDLANELLNAQAQKLWRRYAGKAPRERQLKTRQALYRKGFESDAISRWLAERADE